MPNSSSSKTANEPAKNRPVHTVRHNSIKASVWLNPTEKGPMYNVTFSRSYRDEKGEWHDSGSYGFDDLMILAKAAFDAHTWISTQKAQQQDEQSQGSGQSRRNERNTVRQPASV